MGVQQEFFDLSPQDQDPGSLVRVGSLGAEQMSPAQEKFNALARKIEELREAIEKRGSIYDSILSISAKQLGGLPPKLGTAFESIALSIDKAASGFKLGARQRALVGDLILLSLDQAFMRAPASAQGRELYDRWSETSYLQEIALQEDAEQEVAKEIYQRVFGKELDPEILKAGPEAIHAAFEAAAQAQAASQGSSQGPSHGQRKARGKKESATQARQKAAQELEKKTIRSLYLSLAKALHPDAEPDPGAKLEKESLMKEVISAYEGGDLHSLLKLEAQWLNRETSRLQELSEDKLALYLSALKAQVTQLKAEYQGLAYAPRYQGAQAFLCDDLEQAKRRVKKEAAGMKRMLKMLDTLRLEFLKQQAKADFLSLVDICLEEF